MTRIERTFETLRGEGRKALVGFLMAGDPDLEQSERIIRAALDGGVDILELGVPFSDPTADGPVIQAAGQRALAAGTNLPRVLELTARVRQDYAAPIVLFGYANPFLSYGYARLARDAAAAGADALLVVDVPFEEAAEIRADLENCGLDFIPLIAPTTSEERAARILRQARGFVYYIMVRGVTGARTAVAADLAEAVTRLRRCTRLPIAAGFGVSTGAQARDVAAAADGVVVGSALVQAARDGNLAELVRELRVALD
jgi:tryptophan synthase alpha chain